MFMAFALGWSPGGQKYNPNTPSDTGNEDYDGYGEDFSIDGLEDQDTGPSFKDTLGWKALDVGESAVWTSIHGTKLTSTRYQVFLAGFMGTLVWYDSKTKAWTVVDTGETLELASVWASSDKYIAVCGEDGLLKRRYDFSATGNPQWYNDDLTTGISTYLESIHGSDDDNLWSVGEEGVILQLEDGSWTNHAPSTVGIAWNPAPDLHSVYVVSPTEATIVGDGVLILYKDGEFTVLNEPFA